MITVTKSFTFAYAHNLPGYDGKCCNNHGHTGVLEIEMGCRNDNLLHSPDTNGYPGMIVDFHTLSDMVKEHVLDKVDHKDLSLVLPEQFLPATTENTVMWIARVLYNPFRAAFGHRVDLVRIRMYESPTSYAEWKL